MEQPNYYSVIPANVRYDKDIKANEKLLYSEISALANKNGYCTASNEYFAKLYEVHKDTISEWITNLKNKGYITTKTIRSGKKVAERKIFITESCRQKHLQVVGENTPQVIGENTLENNTRINNINIYSRVIDFLNKKTGKKYKYSTKKTQDLINARLHEHFTEEDFKKVITTKTKEWKNDKLMCKFLRPETLFGTKFEGYLNQETEDAEANNINNTYNTDFSEYDKFAK